MAKKVKKSFQKRKIKLSAADKAQRFAANYGVELDESNIQSIKAQYLNEKTPIAKGKYKGRLTGEDIAKSYIAQRTPDQLDRDLKAASLLAGRTITESEFLSNIDDYDKKIQAEIERIKKENPNASGTELAHLVAVQVFRSPD